MDTLTMEERIEVIEELMKKNRISGEIVNYNEQTKMIGVEVIWGDWKHEHGRLDDLMWETFEDLHNINVAYTEEDKSDCYSAIHFYHFK